MKVQIDVKVAQPPTNSLRNTACRVHDLAPQFWRRLIFGAVQEAKRTRCGVPTDEAILARWWLTEHRPDPSCTDEWERSFDGACERLGRDPVVLRKQLIDQIDKSIKRQSEQHLQSVIYIRRAMVLACAGVPTAISRQYLLALVDERSHDEIAGIDHGDQYIMYDQREMAQAG